MQSKVNVPIAVTGRTSMPIKSTHITSSDFMMLRPVSYRHCFNDEHGNVSGSLTDILEPLSVVTYGKARHNLRAFWVPFRILYKRWDAFQMDTVAYHSNSIPSIPQTAPFFYASDIQGLLQSIAGYEEVTDQSIIDAGAYDFFDDSKYWRFTRYGQFVMSILESLGYRWDYITKPSTLDAVVYNAFNLLAFVRVYLDWYIDSRYMDSQNVAQIETIFERIGESDSYHISALELFALINGVWYVSYDSTNFLISAWESPVAPNGNNGSIDYVIPDITRNFPISTNSPGSYYTLTGVSQDQVTGTASPFADFHTGNTDARVYNGYGITSQYVDSALHSLNDFLKRNQLSSRAIDRALMRFGVQLKGENIKRSVYCGFKSCDIEFGQVVSTADTNLQGDSNLGDRAGIGNAHSEFSFDYDSDGEAGVFIILSSIIPDAGIFEGYDKVNRYLTRLDWWTAEFDQLGTAAIEKGEVVVFKNTSKIDGPYSNVFAFAPSYYGQKVGRDFFTGQISFKSAHLGGSSYHLFREMQNNFNSVSNIVHSLNFTLGRDHAQYDRIFTNTSEGVEHFVSVYQFNYSISSPAKSLFDSYDWQQAGKVISIENGAKVN